MASCANRGMGPQGGPVDSIPPVVVRETPVNGSLNYKSKRVEIVFNEYVQLDDVSKHVLISPPQQRPPEVKAISKKVILVFDEELRDSTTYTIDFGSAICDYHEKVPLTGYSLSFSTGDVIDSLEMSGFIVNAEDLNPISGIVIGIHSNHHDSAYSTIPFDRIAKSDASGAFTIRNIAPGEYRMYGLKDGSSDYIYQPGEGLAFEEDLTVPICHTELESDTLWRDSVVLDSLGVDTIATRVIDTIQQNYYTYYEPSDKLLWYFKEDKTRQYFQRCYREQPHLLRFQFAAPQDSMPVFRALRPSELDSTRSDSAWIDWMDYALIQACPTKDTILCWLTDSSVIKMDSLIMEMTYYKSDSLYNLVPKTDTIYAVYRAPKLSEKQRAAMEKRKKKPVTTIVSNASSKFPANGELILSMSAPLTKWETDSMHLFQKLDTVYKPLPFKFVSLDSARLRFKVDFPVESEQMYEFRYDSAAFTDIFGFSNNAGKEQLKVRSIEEYSTLLIKMAKYDSRIRLQLLDDKDQVVRELPALPEGTKFDYIEPKTYYLRMYIDENGDSKWTTGDWATHRQPEKVYYFPSKLSLRANWDFEETFDYEAKSQLDSKPQELLKDASEQKKK